MTNSGSADGEHELLVNVGEAMLRSAPAAWTSLRFDVTAAANMVKVNLEVELTDGTVTQKLRPERGTGKLCADLRYAMHQEGKGAWYNARFTVDRSHQISAEFDYENAPFGGMANDDDPESEGTADPELLLEDHRMFPRDPEVLPEWHPARPPGQT